MLLFTISEAERLARDGVVSAAVATEMANAMIAKIPVNFLSIFLPHCERLGPILERGQTVLPFAPEHPLWLRAD
jgi:hypothetical protein